MGMSETLLLRKLPLYQGKTGAGHGEILLWKRGALSSLWIFRHRYPPGKFFSQQEIDRPGCGFNPPPQIAHHLSERIPCRPWRHARAIRSGKESLWLGST